MINNLRKIVFAASALFLISAPVLVPAIASAQVSTGIQQNLCGGTNASATDNTGCNTGTANTEITNLMNDLINLFSLLVGIVSVIMIIIGGFKYITSNGDTSNISSAKNTIIFALVGLVIVAMAQFIVHFVLGKVAGVTS